MGDINLQTTRSTFPEIELSALEAGMGRRVVMGKAGSGWVGPGSGLPNASPSPSPRAWAGPGLSPGLGPPRYDVSVPMFDFLIE